MVMYKLRLGQALNTVSLAPNSRAEINIFHIEKVVHVHAANRIKDIALNDKARAHHPLCVEWKIPSVIILHQVAFYALWHEWRKGLAAPRKNIKRRVKTTCGVLTSSVWIDKIQTNYTDILVFFHMCNNGRDAVVLEIGVWIQNKKILLS